MSAGLPDSAEEMSKEPAPAEMCRRAGIEASCADKHTEEIVQIKSRGVTRSISHTGMTRRMEKMQQSQDKYDIENRGRLFGEKRAAAKTAASGKLRLLNRSKEDHTHVRGGEAGTRGIVAWADAWMPLMLQFGMHVTG